MTAERTLPSTDRRGPNHGGKAAVMVAVAAPGQGHHQVSPTTPVQANAAQPVAVSRFVVLAVDSPLDGAVLIVVAPFVARQTSLVLAPPPRFFPVRCDVIVLVVERRDDEVAEDLTEQDLALHVEIAVGETLVRRRG